MAWEDFEKNGVTGMTGGKPIDELAITLDKIAAIYLDHFSRKPTTIELAYCLEQIIGSDPERYVSDSDGLQDILVIIRKEK